MVLAGPESNGVSHNLNGACVAILTGMTVRRLPRGTRVKPVRVSWLIEEARKERFDQLAAQAGVSSAVFLESVIEHLEDELTDRGLPSWWPTPAPSDEELPITSP